MKIAIIGAKGFVGSSLHKFLAHKHNVFPVTRDSLDVLDPTAVQQFVEKSQFDVIINAAATMKDISSLHDTRNNLGMFMNFHRCRLSFGKFINLGSGAEFDRTRNIHNVEPGEIFQVIPTDSYGFGQNIKSRICFETNNFYTIRIFNCFGPGEIATRIFPKYLQNSSEFVLYDDRYFDYFGIQDLCCVVEHCVNNTWEVKDINAVYSNKFKISEVLLKFCLLNNLKTDFVIKSMHSNNYTGSSYLLDLLKINLIGLDASLSQYLNNV